MSKLLLRPVILLIPLLLVIAGVTIAIKDGDGENYKITQNDIYVEHQINLPKEVLILDSKVGGNLLMLDSGSQIDWFTVSSGNTEASSANYGMIGTAAQAAAGYSSSDNFGVVQGFWLEPESSSNCCGVPGDANNDAVVNILDITFLISYLYKGGAAPPCMYEGDANADCTVNILDITYLINNLYKAGSDPVCAASCPGW